jgi:hypothetical protein
MTISTARTIYYTVSPPAPAAPGEAVTEPTLTFPTKTPGMTLDHTIDFTGFLNDISDTINTSTVAVVTFTPSGPTATQNTFTPTALTWNIAGGVITSPLLTTYAMAVSFTTTAGMAVAVTAFLPVGPIASLEAQPGVFSGINSSTMLTWLSTLPTSMPAHGNWWNNAGVPTYYA